MIASADNKLYQKILKKGDGSILKAIRMDKGAGRGLIAVGIMFLVLALLIGLPIVAFAASKLTGIKIFIIMLLPSLLFLVLGIVLKKKRIANWLSYYQKAFGYSEEELLQIDRELASGSVRLVVCKRPGGAEDYIYSFMTEHYVLINGVYPYLKKLDDFIAVAFSNSTDQWCMASLTKQDTTTMAIPLFTNTEHKQALCMEVMQELYRHNPEILCGQQIVCEGKVYILERDGETLSRLYKEGHTLELVK